MSNKATKNKGGGRRKPTSEAPSDVARRLVEASASDDDTAALGVLLGEAAELYGRAKRDRSYTPAAALLRQVRELMAEVRAVRATETEQASDPAAVMASLIDNIRALPDVAREALLLELEGQDGTKVLPFPVKLKSGSG